MAKGLVGLWRKVPRRWKVRAFVWAASFVLGLVVRGIWGVERLLLVVLVVSFSAAWLRRRAINKISWLDRWMNKVERWTQDQFWGIVRGMALSVVTPSAWDTAWRLYKDPSVPSALALALVLAVVAIIYGGTEYARKSQVRASSL